VTAATVEQQARCQAGITAALHNPRRPRWTAAEQTRNRAQLLAALDGTEWQQPIPPRPRKAA
jgi:hypothetical protein